MHAMDFYVSTCRHVMQTDHNNPESLSELFRCLRCLRQSLSCYVCTKIVMDPMGPGHSVCQHSVCTGCLGGKMKLKPSCSWCKDHNTFLPKPLLKTLVACFRKLCEYIYTSHIGEVVRGSTINGETNSLLMILQEAMDSEDDTQVCNNWASLVSSETSDQTDHQSSHDEQGTSSVTVMHEMNEPSTSALTDEEQTSDEESQKRLTDNETEMPNLPRSRTTKRIKRSNLIEKKSTKKAVVFMKRASQNRQRNANEIKKTVQKKFEKKCKSTYGSKTKGRNCNSKCEEEEKTSLSEEEEKTMPVLKKVKDDDSVPPELKPSFCRCGKSGNFNQLTCLGQRCPCYSMKLPCVGCKCKGCRNPRKGPMSDSEQNCNSTTSLLRSGARNHSESLCVNM